MTAQENALRKEIWRFLAEQGYRSPTTPMIDLLFDWEHHNHPPEEQPPDVVSKRRAK